jgi:uncharacterized protein (TIGR03437 family)
MRTSYSFALTIAFLAAPVLCLGQDAGVITTVAGTGTLGFSGDGGPATSAQLRGTPLGVASDSAGNIFIVDSNNNRIRKVNTAGIISTVAGGGSGVGAGDGGPATAVQIFPQNVVVDGAGNLFFTSGFSVRKVSTSGILSTVAGGSNPLPGFSGDGGPATAAQVSPTNVAVDNLGNLYLADSINNRIRKVNTAGIITTVAGNGTSGFSGDGGPATSAKLSLPQGVATDNAGNFYFADAANGRVRKVDTSGVITTVAGNGSPLSVIGDGGPATSAGMVPLYVTLDSAGNIYIAEPDRIRKVNTDGIISKLAGGNQPDPVNGIGDGGPAGKANLSGVTAVAVDGAGNVYIADARNNRIRKVSAGAPAASPITLTPSTLSFSYTTGGTVPPSQSVVIIAIGATLTFTASVSTSSGGSWLAVNPTSGPVQATLSVSVLPTGLSPGTYNGGVTLTPSGSGNTPAVISVTLNVNAPVSEGVITTVAGNGFVTLADGVQATTSGLGPTGVAVDSAGNLYATDVVNNRVRKVNAAGIISTLAGNGEFAFAGDGGPAINGSVFTPLGLATDNAANVYIADTLNYRIRKVDPAGILTTVAGNGNLDFSGDGGLATKAAFAGPTGVAVDSAGNLYIADGANNRIRKVDQNGIITTVAGSGIVSAGFSGDGGPATSAKLFGIGGVALGSDGSIYVSDLGNFRIRKVNPAGIITTVAGNGTRGFSGDGGAATSAQINPSTHMGLAVDSSGNLYFADVANHRIRKVDTKGIITTVAGNGIAGFSGDGGPATTAGLNNPQDVAVDSAGNLYIADGTNNRIRKVSPGGGGGGTAILSVNATLNAASFSASPGFTNGALGTIFGTGLATSIAQASTIPLPVSLGGASVTIGGVPAPLTFVSPTQINLQVPWNLQFGMTDVVVTVNGGASVPYRANIFNLSPAIFSTQFGVGQAIAINPDGSLAAPAGSIPGIATKPAKVGDTIIILATGLGLVTPGIASGAASSDVLRRTILTPNVLIGGVPGTVSFSGLSPQFVGVNQLNVVVPNVPAGVVSLQIDEASIRTTDKVTIAVTN